jgi:hypothetical protein
MSISPRRRLAVALTVAGTLAAGLSAGPAMAASDAASPADEGGKAGGAQMESVLHVRKAGGDGNPYTGYIIAVL